MDAGEPGNPTSLFDLDIGRRLSLFWRAILLGLGASALGISMMAAF